MPTKKQWLWQLQSSGEKKNTHTKATTWQRLSDISMVINRLHLVMTLLRMGFELYPLSVCNKFNGQIRNRCE